MELAPIYTIGYGSRDLQEFLDLLHRFEIKFLVDVRSVPVSRFKPSFSQDALHEALDQRGIRYVFMGNLLGGRPADKECYANGKVDYAKVQATAAFHTGVQRLRIASAKGLSLCLMCSEGKPEECHRSKLIGRVLDSEGILVQHIGSDGTLATQRQVMDRILGCQITMFEEPLLSRKSYRKS